MTKAILINGADRIESRLTGIEQRVEAQLQAQGYTTETIYVHQLPAEDLIRANFASPAIVDAITKVGDAQVVVVLTPIYKGAYSGILKTFIDLLPQYGLAGKTAIPVAIGGSIAHLLALEYALNPVLSILGATTITSPIFVVDKQVARDGNTFIIDAEIEERIAKVVASVGAPTFA